jgi:23S rRNA (cytidine2498-2'-O)-methyltransferase
VPLASRADIPQTPFAAYLAAECFERELEEELGNVVARHGRLLIAPGPPRHACWSANTWRNPQLVQAPSIGQAARTLRGMAPLWAGYQLHLFRRAALIADSLPRVATRPLAFPVPSALPPLASWTLLDAGTLLVATDCTRPFPNGRPSFAQDHTEPPSRAYLKLWEAFTLLGTHPSPGQRCLDLGASPGSWTWVLHQLGSTVVAVDKAALEPRIAALDRVSSICASAFSLDPASLGPFDWVFSDMACYPQRLYSLVLALREAWPAARFLCSVKLQGAGDDDALAAFSSVPGSCLFHLHANGHELTWALVKGS